MCTDTCYSELAVSDPFGYATCAQTCLENYNNELFSVIKLFALEKEARLTFDSVYVADLSPFEDFEFCKRKCLGKAMCLLSCNQELQKRLDEEVKFSLTPAYQVLFQSEMSQLQEIFDCYSTSRN